MLTGFYKMPSLRFNIVDYLKFKPSYYIKQDCTTTFNARKIYWQHLLCGLPSTADVKAKAARKTGNVFDEISNENFY